MKSNSQTPAASRAANPLQGVLLATRRGATLLLAITLAACMVGPDYRKSDIEVPTAFKEVVVWQRAAANPQAAISSTWWRMYGDDKLTSLVEQSLKANQSVAAAEAAYRTALATVDLNRAGLFPTVKAGFSGARSGGDATALGTAAGNSVVADVSASWEIDLWGQVRRQVEEARANAQASDAQLAGVRISIAASVANDYLQLRQADYDIRMLEEQQDIDSKILVMAQTGLAVGAASNDDVLNAQATLEIVVADLQSAEITREQDEHAIAVLVGSPPESFSVAVDPDYQFAVPAMPTGLPSQLLLRRYDVVSAERTAAAGNANIGVAEAAFYPSLTLSAEGGYAHNTLANLFAIPNRFWTLGPELAETLFDGGARTASVNIARGNYEQNVATYRNTVLTAFQGVEDSLSAINHLQAQQNAYAKVLDNNQRLFASQQAQFAVGASSQQNVLTQRLTLIQAEENLRDTQALLAESNVTLVKNLGGGWQGEDAQAAAPSVPNPDVSQAAKPCVYALAPD